MVRTSALVDWYESLIDVGFSPYANLGWISAAEEPDIDLPQVQWAIQYDDSVMELESRLRRFPKE